MSNQPAELPQELHGVVTPYAGNGRKLGYPTANISTKSNLPDGVYFGFATLAEFQSRPALVFVGVPTTVGDTVHRVEAHLLDIPDKDYYHQHLRLDVQYFHRPNKKLANIDELQTIMKQDEATARKWFAKNLSPIPNPAPKLPIPASRAGLWTGPKRKDA